MCNVYTLSHTYVYKYKYVHTRIHIYIFLMRDEKEERRSNQGQTKIYMYTYRAYTGFHTGLFVGWGGGVKHFLVITYWFRGIWRHAPQKIVFIITALISNLVIFDS